MEESIKQMDHKTTPVIVYLRNVLIVDSARDTKSIDLYSNLHYDLCNTIHLSFTCRRLSTRNIQGGEKV